MVNIDLHCQGIDIDNLSDSVGCIILNKDRNLFLQKRDDDPSVFFPSYWGCFGGSLEPGENPLNGIVREIHEELDLKFDVARFEPFQQIAFSLPNSNNQVIKTFFVLELKSDDEKIIDVREGQYGSFFNKTEALSLSPFVPLDFFAVWVYFVRATRR